MKTDDVPENVSVQSELKIFSSMQLGVHGSQRLD